MNEIVNYFRENIWFILFLIWSFALGYYRSRFRKLVYQTEDWMINIKPLFLKEIKGLFLNLYPENKEYLKMRNFYRFYLMVYLILLLCWRFMP